MDLKPLTIDRSSAAVRRRRGKGQSLLRWAVFLAVLAGLGWYFRAPIQAKLDAVRLPEVEVMVVAKTSRLAATAVSGTAANGYIVAKTRAALSADTPGRIVEMLVTEGSVVKKGDVVARLYSEEYRADVRRSDAEYEAAKATVARAEADRAVAEADVLQAKSAVTASAAAVRESVSTQTLAESAYGRVLELVNQGFETDQALDEAIAERARSLAAFEAAQANEETARVTVSRAEVRLAAASAAVLEARARIPVVQAERDRANATLEKTEVRAPFDGVVVLKDAEVGEVVSPNSLGGNSRGSVATMVDFASLEVQVELAETSIAAVDVGVKANIYLDAYPDVLFTGRVDRIWPTANRQKAKIEVRVVFDAPDERLRPEMGVRVVFSPTGGTPVESADPEAAAEADAERILIPSGAVVRIEGRSGVFQVERGNVRFVPLELGDERSGRILIKAGLSGGERIVAAPQDSLQDGDRVRVAGG